MPAGFHCRRAGTKMAGNASNGDTAHGHSNPGDPKVCAKTCFTICLKVTEEQLIVDELDGHKGRMHREEKTAQKQIKEAAKRGDMTSAKLLARELVRTRKAVRTVCRLAVMRSRPVHQQTRHSHSPAEHDALQTGSRMSIRRMARFLSAMRRRWPDSNGCNDANAQLTNVPVCIAAGDAVVHKQGAHDRDGHAAAGATGDGEGGRHAVQKQRGHEVGQRHDEGTAAAAANVLAVPLLPHDTRDFVFTAYHIGSQSRGFSESRPSA